MIKITQYGNTSAASIPLCLDECRDRIPRGANVILTAFGAGYTWGALYIKWSL